MEGNGTLKNVMEELVFEKLDDLMEKLGCCTCDNCRMDSAAFALIFHRNMWYLIEGN